MPLPGRKPKENRDQIRHRNKSQVAWTEVEDRPFEGGPDLVEHPTQEDWPLATLRWWEAVRKMPHCVLWGRGDWQFAFDTAIVAAKFHCGAGDAATELRIREKQMGTTFDALRDLRIRYIDPGAVEEVDEAKVSAMADYRRMAASEADEA